MDSSELIELFYNRTYEEFVNKHILDDKNYIVPRQQLTNYVRELVNIPFIDFLEYIKQNGIDRRVEASDITQFSSFSACEIEMCKAFIWANNPGCQYFDIGRLFPNNTIGRSDAAYRRYGESHIKAATQLGLTFEYYNYWYLSCLGYIYPDLDEDVRKHLLARTITRNRLYQQMLIDILDHDVDPVSYISISSDSTLKKRFYSVCRFFNICLEECMKQGIHTHQIKGRTIDDRRRQNSSIPDNNDFELSIHYDSFLNEIARYPLYSIEEEIDFFQRYEKGDKTACNKIIESNLRFVVSIAKTYRNQGLELHDLIQEGTIGLINAVEHFDYTRGIPFIKYAIWWIRLSITKALVTQPYIVQIPYNTITLHRKVREFIDTFEQKQGYFPSVDEIDVNESSDFEWLNYISQLPADLKEMTCLVDDFDVYESSGPQTDDFQEAEYNSYYINRHLLYLENRNSTILRKYFGIGEKQEAETLSAIGDSFGLTRERARQIVEKSIRQLRDICGIKRDVANVGDLIRLDSTEQVGRIISTKTAIDGSTIFVLKMESGTKEEILANDYYSYSILIPKRIPKKTIKKRNLTTSQIEVNSQSIPKETIQHESDLQRIVSVLDGVKVGDILRYNGKECTIRKILCRGSSSKLLIEYVNGVLDYVPNDKSRYRIVHFQKKPHHHISEERNIKSEYKHQDVQEVSVGDRIVYNTKPCIVLEKSKKYNIIRLKVRYDDGKIDNVLGDKKKYEILYRYGKDDKMQHSQKSYQERKEGNVGSPNHEEKSASTRKSREELTRHNLKGNITPQHTNDELESMPQFFTTTPLSKLVGLGIITKKQLAHCHKKGLTTIGDIKKIIDYYRLTPNSTRFTKYTLDMWFGIVGLLNNNV